MADPIGATLTLDISDVKRSLTEANKLIKENEANWRINAAAMGDWTKSEEGLNDRMRFLSKTIEQQEKNVEGLVKARDEAIAKYGKESYEVQDLNSKIITQSKNLEKSRKEYDKLTDSLENMTKENSEGNDELEDTAKQSKKASRELDKLEKEAKDAGDGFSIAGGAIATFAGNVLSSLVSSIGSAVSSLFGLTEATLEYRREMARVTTVADQVGVSGDRIIDKWIDMNAVIQDESSVTEGLNNLMTAGFTAEKELDAITKALEGASIQWAETLKFEGLSDSLQEWIGSKGASLTGQFAELLERLGYNLDDVTEATKGMTDAQRRNWAIQTLNKAGLDDVSEGYRTANKDMIDYNKAQADLLNAQAAIGEQMQPFSTLMKQSSADILYAFVDMVNGVEGAGDRLLYTVGYLAGSIWKGIQDLWETVRPLFSEFVTVKIPEFIGGIIAKVPSWIASIAETVWNEAPTIVESLMDGIANGLQTMVDGIENDIAKGILNDLIDAFKWLSDNSEVVVSAIAAIVVAIGTFKIIKTVTTWINIATAAIAALNAILAANPVGLVITAVAALTAGLIALYSKCEPFRDWVNSLWDGIKAFWENCKEFFADIGAAFADFWSGLKGGFSDILGWFSNKITDFKNIGINIVEGIVEGIKSMGQLIVDAANWIYEHTIGAILNFFGIRSPSTVMRDKVGKNIVSGIVEGIKSMLSTITNGAQWIFDNTIGRIKGLFQGGSLGDIGRNVVQGIVDGIQSMKNAVENAANWVYDNTVGRVKKWLGIASPSKVMRDEVGIYIAEGLAVGIKDGEHYVAESAEELVEAGIRVIKEEMQRMPEEGEETAIGFAEGFEDGMKGVRRDLSEATEEAVEGAAEGLSVSNAGSAIAEEIGTAVSEAVKDYSKYVDISTDLASALKEGSSSDIAEGIFGALGQLGGAWGAMADSIWSFISDNLLGMSKEEVQETAEKMLGNLLDTVMALMTDMPSILSGAIEFMRTFAVGLIRGIPEIVRKLPEIISEMVEGLISEGVPAMFEVGGELIRGLIEGMFNIGNLLWNAIKGIGQGIVNGFKKLFGIHSPSKVMADEVGRNLALGIEEGLVDNLKSVNGAIRKGVDASVKLDGVQRKQVNVYQTNHYAEAHSRYELYKSKQDTANAVRLAMQGA